MKVKVVENFGERRQFEIEGSDLDNIQLKVMRLLSENNQNKIKDEYYYKFELLEE